MKIRLFLILVFILVYSPDWRIGAALVKPVWKTPISEPNPTDDDGNNQTEHSNLAKRAQPNYYTRPEQVSIPDYRPPKRIPILNPYQQRPQNPAPIQFPYPPPHNPPTGVITNPFYPNQPGHFRPFAWVGAQPTPGSPQTSYFQQVPNKGQSSFSHGLPPLPNNWQQYPMQMIWIPDSGPSPQSSQSYNGKNVGVNTYPANNLVPQNPYSNGGGGPVPPVQYGVYGPPQSTKSPMSPSAYPEGYTGTLIHSPSANPTTPMAETEATVPNSYGGGEGPTAPTTTGSSYGSSEYSTSGSSTSETSTYPESSTDFISSEPSTVSAEQPSTSSTGSTNQRNPTIRPGPQEPSKTTKPALPYDADGTRDLETTASSKSPKSNSPLFEMTRNPFEEGSSSKTVPPVYLGSEEESNDDTEDITTTSSEKEKGDNGHSPAPTPGEEEEDMMKNFFPRPVSPQGYQPPGHQPEDFGSHINVNFKKPKGCVPPFCRGVDVDKISLYKPDRDNEGTGPTLVISNAAKDDAHRAGYKPAPPPVNPYIPPPPPPIHPNEYETPFTNPPEHQPFPPFKEYSGVPYIPTTPQQPRTSENSAPTVPPRALIPAHNFPPPSGVTPPEEEYIESTAVPFVPTAQTISTRYVPTAVSTTPTPRATSTSGKESSEEEAPEYVPPAIIHMTASTPSGKNPPTYKPLHPEVSSIRPTEASHTSETQTPATVTRQPEFPVKPSQGTNPPQVVTTTNHDVEKENSAEQTTPVHVAGGNFPPSSTTTTSFEPSKDTSTFGTTENPSTSIRTTEYATATPETGFTSISITVPTEQPTSVATQVFTDRESTDSAFFSSTPQTTNGVISPSTTPVPPAQPSTTAEWIYTTEGSYPSSPPEVSSPGINPSTLPPSQPPRNNPYAPPEGAPRVPNRLIGKPKIVCKEDGISFEVKTILPLNGEVFANDRKRIPECQRTFVEDAHPKMFLPFSTCGVKNIGDQIDSRAQFHMQVVLIIDQGNGTNTLQSFMAQCVHQKVNYNKQVLPKRIEEALEELRLVPSKLEQKASMPTVQMQIVVDEGHHKLGPEVSAADIGMPLALRWKLVPESDAYGMHVRNCKVVDAVGKSEHFLIDEQGCSADLQIIDHPHYDTYHDTASAHMWAFKVPDMASLQIKCDILICSNIKSSITNTTSCEDIPSPPFCADLVTSPPNSILSDASSYIKTRRSSLSVSTIESASTQSVRTSICLSKSCRPQSTEDVRVCINTQLATTSTGLSIAFLLFAISFQIIARTKSNN